MIVSSPRPLVPEQEQENDHRDRHTEQPEQYRGHFDLLENKFESEPEFGKASGRFKAAR
jgi:hypothetical protein